MIRRDYTTGCSIDMFNDAADTVIWLRSVGRKEEATELYNRLYAHKVQTPRSQPTVEEAVLCEDIASLYEWNDIGGPLHIVLDDGNVDDGSIQFCLSTCHRHWSVLEDTDNTKSVISLVQSIGVRMLDMPEQERDALYKMKWFRPVPIPATPENTTQQT